MSLLHNQAASLYSSQDTCSCSHCLCISFLLFSLSSRSLLCYAGLLPSFLHFLHLGTESSWALWKASLKICQLCSAPSSLRAVSQGVLLTNSLKSWKFAGRQPGWIPGFHTAEDPALPYQDSLMQSMGSSERSLSSWRRFILCDIPWHPNGRAKLKLRLQMKANQSGLETLYHQQHLNAEIPQHESENGPPTCYIKDPAILWDSISLFILLTP